MHDRREFLMMLGASMAAASGSAGGSAAAQAPKAGPILKSALISMLPRDRPYLERFELARRVGFAGIEMQTVSGKDEAAEIKEASATSGLKIHSVMNMDHWKLPLSSGDPAIVSKGVAGMETSLRNAALWGADAVLLVPAVVDSTTSYRDAWTRSQPVIRERNLPLARELKVIVAVEEVWNKFLLSPIEFARYVDEFESPWVRAYFDVGNVVFFGFPQDWIRTLGSRIVKVHVKDFRVDRQNGRFAFGNVGEGDIDWPEVRRALGEIKYSGYITTEVQGGDEAYLKDLVGRLDRFLAGEPPVALPPKQAGVV
jgi:L-ribulose-5-phosphate 3-epimerase